MTADQKAGKGAAAKPAAGGDPITEGSTRQDAANWFRAEFKKLMASKPGKDDFKQLGSQVKEAQSTVADTAVKQLLQYFQARLEFAAYGHLEEEEEKKKKNSLLQAVRSLTSGPSAPLPTDTGTHLTSAACLYALVLETLFKDGIGIVRVVLAGRSLDDFVPPKTATTAASSKQWTDPEHEVAGFSKLGKSVAQSYETKIQEARPADRMQAAHTCFQTAVSAARKALAKDDKEDKVAKGAQVGRHGPFLYLIIHVGDQKTPQPLHSTITLRADLGLGLA